MSTKDEMRINGDIYMLSNWSWKANYTLSKRQCPVADIFQVASYGCENWCCQMWSQYDIILKRFSDLNDNWQYHHVKKLSCTKRIWKKNISLSAF